jgi:mono/diheme cytochrome c family protein
MATPSTFRSKKIFVSRSNVNSLHARIFVITCFTFLAAVVVCSLPRPSASVVHAYSKKSKQSGSVLFHEKGCEHCHGVDGRGGELGPDLSTIGKRWKNQQIEHQISEGSAGMPAFKDALQPDEIKDLVDYLHAKRKASKKPVLLSQPIPPTT